MIDRCPTLPHCEQARLDAAKGFPAPHLAYGVARPIVVISGLRSRWIAPDPGRRSQQCCRRHRSPLPPLLSRPAVVKLADHHGRLLAGGAVRLRDHRDVLHYL